MQVKRLKEKPCADCRVHKNSPKLTKTWVTMFHILMLFLFRFYGLLNEFDNGRVSGESSRRGTTWMSERMRKAVKWLKRKS